MLPSPELNKLILYALFRLPNLIPAAAGEPGIPILLPPDIRKLLLLGRRVSFGDYCCRAAVKPQKRPRGAVSGCQPPRLPEATL